MTSFKDFVPDKDYVVNMLDSKCGTIIEPLLVNISSGSRKNSVNFHFVANGCYFYAQMKRNQINDKGNTLVILRCSNFQNKCTWNGRLEYLHGKISPDIDDFYNHDNWKVQAVPSTPGHANMSDKHYDELPTTLQCKNKNELARCCNKNPQMIYVKARF